MRSLLVVPVLAAIALPAGPASAGALGDVVDGLKRASDDDDDDKPTTTSPKDDDSSSSDDDSDGWDWSSSSYSSSASRSHVHIGLGLTPPPPGDPGMHVYLYLAGQSVVDSDGSLTLELRGWYDDFGIGVRQTSFFEKAEPDYLRLDLWSLSGHYRVLEDAESELWIEGGLGGFRTIDDLTMWGAQGGLRAEHAFNHALGMSAEGRIYLLEENVRASELRAAFRASILVISYRIVDFNVGPPLHGPEVGLAFTF